MRSSTLAAAVAATLAVAVAAVPVHAASTRTHTRHVAAAKPPTRVTVTRRSYLDPGTEVLPQAHAGQYLYSLGFMQHNRNYEYPGSPFSVNAYPLSDPFFLPWH